MSTLSTKRTETGGIACGARVMLTTNVDVSDGLLNGAKGEIVHFVTSNSNEVTHVLAKFDNEQVGMQVWQSGQYHSKYPNAVPFSKVKVVFLA